ncbi:MAG: DUF924 family protein [Rhodanobacter sp.]
MSVRPTANASDILDFWFAPAHAASWFVKDADFDAELRQRFGAEREMAAQGRLDDWAAKPESWLALLLLLDQLPRNLYRGSGRAWAADVKAQRVALSGLDDGFDQALPPLRRVFAYLPLEHAENMGLQQRAVALFEALHAQVPADERERFSVFLDYARRHHEVISRFGRFPHRNAALGRSNTPDETDYLAQAGAGF